MRALLLVLLFTGVSCAQEKERKRLESVTWDLKSHKLVWVVQTGKVTEKGDFTPVKSDRYEITPDKAMMTVRDESRGFTRQEADAVRELLDVLSRYCAASVEWWDKGEGTPLDGAQPNKPPKTFIHDKDGKTPPVTKIALK